MLEQRPPDKLASTVEQGTLFDQHELARLTVKHKEWEETTLHQSLQRLPESEHLMTTSGVPIARIYTPLDNADFDYQRELGLPGEFPYTRGVQPTMYRARSWTMRMFAGFGTTEDTNKRFKYLLSQGQMGLSTAFDMPTLYG